MKLGEVYDGNKKMYKPGWDDHKVANSVGIDLGLVERRREMDFGPNRFDSTREEFSQAMKEFESAARKLIDMTKMAEQQAAVTSKAFEDIKSIAARIEDKL